MHPTPPKPIKPSKLPAITKSAPDFSEKYNALTFSIVIVLVLLVLLYTRRSAASRLPSGWRLRSQAPRMEHPAQLFLLL